MHVLITGGLGFIGHAVGLRLIDRGHEVTVVDLPTLGVARWSVPSVAPVHTVLADILDVDDWGTLLDDVDAVVHTAGIHQVDEVARDPVRHVDVNVTGTRRMLRACVAHDVHRFVHLSSAKVYGHVDTGPSEEGDAVAPADPYALGKVIAEQYCRHYASISDLETTSVRPFSVYGPGQDTHTGYIGALLEMLRRGGPVDFSGAPHYARDFVHVDTVADVCVAAVESPVAPPAFVNAGCGEPTTLADLVATFADASDCAVDVRWREPRPGTLRYTHAGTEVMHEFSEPDVPDLDTGIRDTIHTLVGA